MILRPIMQFFSPPSPPFVHVCIHTNFSQYKKSTGVTKIGEECAEDMHKGQCGYQVASYIPPPPSPPRYSLWLKKIVQLYMYCTQNFRQNFLCLETINMTSTCKCAAYPGSYSSPTHSEKGWSLGAKHKAIYGIPS